MVTEVFCPWETKLNHDSHWTSEMPDYGLLQFASYLNGSLKHALQAAPFASGAPFSGKQGPVLFMSLLH